MARKPRVQYEGAIYHVMSRTWARGITTAYTNTALGDLLTVQSNGSTVVAYGLDRVGRRTNIIDDAGNRILAYNDAGLPLSETNTSGTMVGIGLVYQYDQYLRKTNVQVWGTNGLILSHSYGFDAAGRLKTVSDGTITAGYSYVADSSLIGQMFLTNNGVLKNTTTKTYDHLNRLLGIQTVTSKTNLLSSNYSYNDANQRKGNRLQDGSYWVYDYDDLGQVTSGKRYWEDGTPVAGQQFEYAFDDIGNRTSTKAGGDSSGGSLRSATYGANLLNQYTNRTVPGSLDVMGIANASATVTVNNQSTYRKGEYYQALVSVANSSTNVFQKITNVATLSGVTNQVAGGTIVPIATQTFRYDPDGNLTNDGVFTFIWDHENRLLLITNSGMAGLPAQKITITYDSQGRRIRYVAQTNNAGTFVNTKFVRYVYDGWNLLAELNATNNTAINTYLWGADLSGTLQGAGGVGGLVAVKNASLGYHAPAYDGNGNVVALVDSGTSPSSGTVSASYEYGPFGEVVRASGSVASVNSFRFSTKYQDEETGFLYYGYRYYNVSSGSWLNRDPMGENGGVNLYCFVQNDSIGEIDPFGLAGSAGDWLTSQIVRSINTARVQGVYRTESSKVFKAAGRAEIGFKYGVIAARASASTADACVDTTIYANFYGQLKFPFVFGTQIILEPSGGAAGKVECCLCGKGGRWEYDIGPFKCRGDVSINAGVKIGLRSPGFDFENVKAYTEGGGFVGWTYSFRRDQSRLNGYLYWMYVFEISLPGGWKTTRRGEGRWGTSVDF